MPSELHKKVVWPGSTQLAPVPTVLVGCGGSPDVRPNLITVAWTGVVCSRPPMISIALRPERYSYTLIRRSGEFTVNLPGADLAGHALHPYAQALLRSVFSLATAPGTPMEALTGEVPSPVDRPTGCPFHTRCPHCMEVCRAREPDPMAVAPDHWVRCHLYDNPAQEERV